jgi:hypothetical protein
LLDICHLHPPWCQGPVWDLTPVQFFVNTPSSLFAVVSTGIGIHGTKIMYHCQFVKLTLSLHSWYQENRGVQVLAARNPSNFFQIYRYPDSQMQ